MTVDRGAVEWLDLVNEWDEVVGQVTRDEAWARRLPVRVVNAFLVNPRGELWIPRRTLQKRMFPGCLDMSVGGHVERGESYEAAFHRETWEELNLDLETVPWREIAAFSPFGTPLSAFMRVYEIRSDTAPSFNPDDFSEAFWLTPADLLARIDAGDPAKGDLAELVRLCYGGGERETSMSRIHLRPLTPADAPLLAAYRNQPEVARYQAWLLPFTLEAAQALIESMRGRTPEDDGWTQLALANVEGDELLGDVAVRRAGPQAEIGVTLSRQAQGRGLATEGLTLLLAHLFGTLGLHRVYASIDPHNIPVARLLTRLGFRHEGTTLESYLHRGEWTDDATYGLLAREWRARHPQENPTP